MATEAKRRASLGYRVSAGVAALLAAVTATMLVAPAVANAALPAPQEDPFYQPPPDFAAAAPGAVLRSRPVQLGLPVPAQSWQLLYRTTDMFDQPEVTVTTVVLPENVRPDRPLMSQQLFEDASGPTCVPSYGLQADTPLDPGLAAQVSNLVRVLQDGWVATLPDFEGRFGHFAVANEPGYMTLDGIRAAEQFAPLGLGPGTQVGLYGYSGGGLATGWAAELHPRYAPELNIVGVGLGAPAPDLGPAALKTNGAFYSGLVGSAMAGLDDAYPDFRAAFRPHVAAEGVARLETISSQCITEIVVQNVFTNWEQYLDIPLGALLAEPPIRAILDPSTLGASAPTAPLYVYQGLADQVVPPSTTDAMVEKYCAAGTSVHYVYDPPAEHIFSGLLDGTATLEWLLQRLDSPAPAGCTNQTL